MEEQIIVREFVFNDEEGAGATLLSLVDEPAIDVNGDDTANFVALSAANPHEQLIPVKLAAVQDGERRMLYGPVLIPDIKIQRGVNFYITFPGETVQKVAHAYLRNGMQGNANIDHRKHLKVDGCTVVESWLKEFPEDKSNGFGFAHPLGTWYVGMECKNDKVWEEVKAGNIKGFSMEAGFANKQDKVMSAEDLALEELNSILSK